VHNSRRKRISPLTEYEFQVSRDAFEDDCRDGDEGAVFHPCSENAVFLGEEERRTKCGVLHLRLRADNNVDLEESVENVNVGRGNVGLGKRRYFSDLEYVSSILQS
jgi:hypothetical protein